MSTKVFVGNLSFKTREPDLAKFFEEIGPVKSTNIIARGPRSLGYGFVEFEKEADAAKAIETLNKKELDGRPINVESVKPREPGTLPPRRAAPIRRAVAPPSTSAAAAAPASAPGAAPAGPAARGARRPRVPRARGVPRAPAAAAVAPTTPAAAPQRQPQQPRVAPRPAPTAAPAAAVPRAPRRPRRPRQTAAAAAAAPNAPLSKTTLFVANLPFVVDDDGLLEIFEGMNVKEAHVVRRVNGRSKGYGFVTFENEADQRHAQESVDKSVVEGRDITVRPALTTPLRKPGQAATTPADAPATPDAGATPAAAAAATTTETTTTSAPQAAPAAPQAAPESPSVSV